MDRPVSRWTPPSLIHSATSRSLKRYARRPNRSAGIPVLPLLSIHIAAHSVMVRGLYSNHVATCLLVRHFTFLSVDYTLFPSNCLKRLRDRVDFGNGITIRLK